MRWIEQSLVRRRTDSSRGELDVNFGGEAALISVPSDGAADPINLGLDRAGFFERLVSPVFVDRFQAARGHANADELFQLRHPDPVFVQIGNKQARHIFGHVPADAPFFLGHTAAVNDAAAGGPRSGDGANFRHGAGMGRKRCRARGDCQAIVERKLDLIRQSLLAQSLGAVQDRHLYLKHGPKK